MYVVILNVEFDEFPMFPFADGFEYPSQFAFDLVRGEYLAPVFRSPDQMVFEVIEAV